MPLYDFTCPACDATFERLTSIGAANRSIECPNCGREAERILSACRVVSEARARACRNADEAAEKRQIRRLPVDGNPPKVELGKPPPVPHRYLKHMLKHGGC